MNKLQIFKVLKIGVSKINPSLPYIVVQFRQESSWDSFSNMVKIRCSYLTISLLYYQISIRGGSASRTSI